MRSFYYDDTDYELQQIDANRFVIPGGNMLEFVPAAFDRPRALRLLDHEGRQVVETLQLSAFVPSTSDLQSLVGEYRSPDIDVTYTVGLRDSNLLIRPPGRAEITVQPLAKDTFANQNAQGRASGRTSRRMCPVEQHVSRGAGQSSVGHT